MNVNNIIVTALSPICGVHPDAYKNKGPKPNEYIVFNYADERPELYANDDDLYDSTTVQVHYFTKGNPQANKKRVRRLLRQAGFSIQSTQQLYESDTGYTHVVVYAEIGGEIDDN